MVKRVYHKLWAVSRGLRCVVFLALDFSQVGCVGLLSLPPPDVDSDHSESSYEHPSKVDVSEKAHDYFNFWATAQAM